MMPDDQVTSNVRFGEYKNNNLGECERRVEEEFEQWVVDLVDSGWSLLGMVRWRVLWIECWLNSFGRVVDGRAFLFYFFSESS
jgi:hypothetical protein